MSKIEKRCHVSGSAEDYEFRNFASVPISIMIIVKERRSGVKKNFIIALKVFIRKQITDHKSITISNM